MVIKKPYGAIKHLNLRGTMHNLDNDRGGRYDNS